MDNQSRSPVDLFTTVVPSPEVLVQELEGEAVLLNLASERYFGLDDVGTRIWQHQSILRPFARTSCGSSRS
jgi:hypothetical protein